MNQANANKSVKDAKGKSDKNVGISGSRGNVLGRSGFLNSFVTLP